MTEAHFGILSVLYRSCAGAAVALALSGGAASASAVWDAFFARCLDAVVQNGAVNVSNLSESQPNVHEALLGASNHYDVTAYDLNDGIELSLVSEPGKAVHGCSVATLQSAATAEGIAAFEAWIAQEVDAGRWRETSGMLGPLYRQKTGGPYRLQMSMLAKDGAMVVALDFVKRKN